MQEGNQKLQLRQISEVGDAVQHIESVCLLPKVDFLKSTYHHSKIKELSTKSNFKDLLAAVLVKISILAGIKNEIDDFVKQDISKMILSSFNELSLEEISKAFELERYCQYEVKTEHFQLFDSNYISAVLKKYKKWKVKEKTELNILAPIKEVEITESQKIELRENLLQLIFSEIKENGLCNDAWHLYQELETSGKINPTKEEKNKLYKEQLKIYEFEEKKLIRKRYDSKIAKTHLQYLSDKITGKTPVESVSNKCRSIIVSNYFKPFLESFEMFKNQLNFSPKQS